MPRLWLPASRCQADAQAGSRPDSPSAAASTGGPSGTPNGPGEPLVLPGRLAVRAKGEPIRVLNQRTSTSGRLRLVVRGR